MRSKSKSMKHFLLVSFFAISCALAAQSFENVILEPGLSNGRIRHARFLDNGTIVYCRENSSDYHFLKLKKMKVTKTLGGLLGRPDGFEISNDHKTLVGTTIENEIGIWKLKKSELLHTRGQYNEDYTAPKSIYFSNDDENFRANFACSVEIWNIKTGDSVRTIAPPDDECLYHSALSNDGKVFYGSGNYHVWKYDLEAAGPENAVTEGIKPLSISTAMCLSPDGKLLAISGREGLWLMDTDFKLLHDLVGHKDWINEIVFSADGKHLYSCSGSFYAKDRSIRKWSTITGECESVMEGHVGNVNSIAVSPNGGLLVSASDDLTMKIWDSKAGKLLCTLVPMTVKGKEELFFYTPEGAFVGPDDFFEQAKFNGKRKKSAELPQLKNAKKQVAKAFK